MDPLIFNLIKTLVLFPIFLFLAILIFYLPGSLLLGKIKTNLRDDEKIVLSLGVGFIIFLLVTIFMALFKIRFLIPLAYLGFTIYALYKFKNGVFAPFWGLFKQKLLMVFLLVGTLVEGFINFPSGFLYKTGHLYWSAQGHDGLWHVAVIEAIKQNFPPQNPLYAGESLYNYHYFSDIITAQFSRLFPFFATLDLYYRYFPFLIAFLMGLAAFTFLTTWTKNKTIGILGIFFTYFVGGFGYLVLAIQGRGFFGGETIFWAAQGNTIIGNPPHAFCYVFLPAFLLAFYYFLKEKTPLFFIICFLLGGFLLGFKVSSAVVLLVGLSFASLFALMSRKDISIVFLTALIGLSNFAIFKTITKAGESFLIFQPWWFIRTMIVVPDRVNWLDLELRRQFYLAKGGARATLRIIEFESIAFFLFLVGNLGTRVIGFWQVGKMFLKKTVFNDRVQTVIFFGLLTAFLIPLFFIQKGVVYNLIQFMQYFLLFFGFLAAISLYNFLSLFKNKFIKVFIFILFFILSVPTVIGNLVEFYGKNPLAMVSNQELAALEFLKANSTDQDIILTKPFDPYSKGLYQSQPWPIYAWDSSGYVSAYTTRQTYVTDEGQMHILGINPEERIKKANAFFDLSPIYDIQGNFLHYKFTEEIPQDEKAEFLRKEKITFIYVHQEEIKELQKETFQKLGLKELFKNQEVTIYKR
jgi:hypothetical protein